jgi:signal peptidase I
VTANLPEEQYETPQAAMAGNGGPDTSAPSSGRYRWVLEWVLVVVVALVAAVLIREFLVQTYFIPSGSMEPTLQIGDRIIVNKLSYHLHSIHRGDIVVFAKPAGETEAPNIKDLVKRVIGLPGETISSKNGMVYINGKALPEPWLPDAVQHETVGITTQVIPKNEYFVMGDNRTDSSDSRVFGPIPRSLIVGKADIRIWPLGRLGFL